MNRQIVCLAIALLLATSAMAQQEGDKNPTNKTRQERRAQRRADEQTPETGAGARIHIEEPTYNFGDVMRRGNNLNHEIAVVNNGTTPLVITRVITSCSCLKAAFPKRPIAPGKSDVVRITYEPLKSEPGAFHKVVQVYSNAVNGRQLITVQGNSIDNKKR